MLYCVLVVATPSSGELSATQAPPSDQLSTMQAAFSRFRAQGLGGHIERAELPSFLQYVVASMNSPAAPQEQVTARSSELTQQLMQHLPLGTGPCSLADILQSTEKIAVRPAAPHDDESEDRGRFGSKQLVTLRRKLERNRLTMPLFDTKGWVRDFEKALKIQWEIYANGLAPMHIVVARSDRIYGTEVVV
jgi:hypothetical protein